MGIKRGIFIIIAIAIILFLGTSIVSFLSLIKEDLTLTLIPNQKSLNLYQGESENLSFFIQPKFNGVCFSICETEFIDLSKGIILSSKNFTIYPFQIKEINQTVESPEVGIGQKSYNLNIRCRSLRTPLCITQKKWSQNTAYITLNYNFNPEKGQIKDIAKSNLTDVLLMLNSTDYYLQETSDIFNQIQNKTVIENKKINKKTINEINFNSTTKQIIDLRRLWEEEEYSLILEALTDEFFEKLFLLNNQTIINNQEMKSEVSLHNQIISFIKNEEKTINLLEFSGFYSDEKRDFLKQYNRFLNLNFSNLQEINNDFFVSKQDLDSSYLSIMQKAKINLSSERNLRCSLKDYCLDNEISENFNDICYNIERNKNEMQNANNYFAYNYAIKNGINLPELSKDNAYELLYAYLNITDYLKNKKFLEETKILYSNEIIYVTNIEIKEQNREIKNLNEKIMVLNSLIKIANLKILENGSEDLNLCHKLISKCNDEEDFLKRKNLVNRTIDYCENKIIEVINGVGGKENITLTDLSSFNLLIEKTAENFTPTFPLDYEIMAINLTSLNNSEIYEFDQKICLMPENYSTIRFNLTELKISEFNSFNQTIEIELLEPVYICCVFGICNVCCTNESCLNDSKSYPIIFLHGHPFNEAHSPEYSLNIFNQLQSKLSEEGFINAGIVSPESGYSEIPGGEWGFSGMPVTIKASYYYNVSQETGQTLIEITKTTEHITAYSDRLQNIIELIKYRTGRNKVNIVAHSMGGLVVREYLRKYGEESINKLIMVGTPNNGILGEVDQYCPVLGAKIECNEMKQNSSFLQELNAYVPKNKTKFYTITGIGCKMNNLNGDGIVVSTNVGLPYARNYNITGSCSTLFSLLHIELLNIKKYPLTYEAIRAALEEY